MEALERRERRLRELGKDKQLHRVNTALRHVWEDGGKRPDPIRLRPEFLLANTDDEQSVPTPMSQLLNPRGIALRFYLLVVFEAQCRLDEGAAWTGIRPIQGRLGWGDFIAIDAAYSSETGTYMRDTKQDRDLASSRVRQIKGALRTFEDLQGQALAEVPRKKNGLHRDYDSFVLMNEAGRGDLPTPDRYRVPAIHDGTIGIPRDFFLHGWVHVLYPSEIATWLTLRFLRSRFPGVHANSGVYLYGQTREQQFHLRRDAYEDGCAMLLALGLVRHAQPLADPAEASPNRTDPRDVFASIDSADPGEPERYEPYRYQLTDEGLREDALDKCLKELAFIRNDRGH